MASVHYVMRYRGIDLLGGLSEDRPDWSDKLLCSLRSEAHVAETSNPESTRPESPDLQNTIHRFYTAPEPLSSSYSRFSLFFGLAAILHPLSFKLIELARNGLAHGFAHFSKHRRLTCAYKMGVHVRKHSCNAHTVRFGVASKLGHERRPLVVSVNLGNRTRRAKGQAVPSAAAPINLRPGPPLRKPTVGSTAVCARERRAARRLNLDLTEGLRIMTG